MTQAEKGKFCGSCQKTVVDFTNMSDRQLAEFFKKPSGSVCGRFQQDQLERDITIPKKRIPWVKYFFQFALPAFLVSMKASAQKKLPIKGDTVVCTTMTMGMVAIPHQVTTDKEISGVVNNEQGEPVSFATIKIKGENKTTTTDAAGRFKLKTVAESNHIIVSAMGYEIVEMNVTTQKEVNVILTNSRTLNMGEVVVGKVACTKSNSIMDSNKLSINKQRIPTLNEIQKTTTNKVRILGTVSLKASNEPLWIVDGVPFESFEAAKIVPDKIKSISVLSNVSGVLWCSMRGIIVVTTESKNDSSKIRTSENKRLFNNKDRDVLLEQLIIYPNPAQRGSSIKIDLKKIQPGTYMVCVINAGGAIVQNKEIIVANKNEVQDFSLPETAAGTYFIRLANKATGKSYTEKIVVQ